jgi:hypothetical protein
MSTHDNLSQLLSRKAQQAAQLPVTEWVAPADEITIAGMNGQYSNMKPADRNLTRIHFMDKTGRVRTFQYAYLDSESTFEGGTFTLIFTGVKHWLITVKGHGKSFWAIYDSITLHRWTYLREGSGSMPEANGEGETVFTKIEFKDITPKPE